MITKELLKRVFDTRFFDPKEECGPAIEYFWHPGESPLVIVVGDNASGKSFFRRIVSSVCGSVDKFKSEMINISMQGRCGGSMYGPMRAMVYGDESWESTGTLSAHTVSTGISTCKGRKGKHLMFWDEPDVGLSDNYAAGIGVDIAGFAKECTQTTLACCVITHRKALLRQIVDSEIDYNYVCLGSNNPPETLRDYVEQPVVPTSVENLFKESRTRFKKIERLLKEKK